ncbi:MAG: thymidylate synthase, partial [Pseudomonadales bacterium]
MNAYLSQLQSILDHGTEKSDRTGVGTISLFGLQSRYDLAEGFPAVTTKKLVWKSMVSELLWFVSGSGNINDLKSIYKSNKLWDLNYQDFLKRHELDTSDGDMGRVYGRQWRHWLSPQGETIDQLTDAIDLIRHNPDSRRIIVNAWNPAEIGTLDVALPP